MMGMPGGSQGQQVQMGQQPPGNMRQQQIGVMAGNPGPTPPYRNMLGQQQPQQMAGPPVSAAMNMSPPPQGANIRQLPLGQPPPPMIDPRRQAMPAQGPPPPTHQQHQLHHQPNVDSLRPQPTPLPSSSSTASSTTSPPPAPPPHGSNSFQQQQPQQLLYGGQMLAFDDVQAMKKRDLRMYGPQFVDAMERMSRTNSFRGGTSGRSTPAGGVSASKAAAAGEAKGGETGRDGGGKVWI